jgi:hypothetical protein
MRKQKKRNIQRTTTLVENKQKRGPKQMHNHQKRPTTVSKETYYSVKRGPKQMHNHQKNKDTQEKRPKKIERMKEKKQEEQKNQGKK